jgi:maltooligosyltrehalose synthase
MNGPSHWEGTVVEAPGGTWRHLFTDQKFTDPKIPLDAIFADFPVAVLVREEAMGENR